MGIWPNGHEDLRGKALSHQGPGTAALRDGEGEDPLPPPAATWGLTATQGPTCRAFSAILSCCSECDTLWSESRSGRLLTKKNRTALCRIFFAHKRIFARRPNQFFPRAPFPAVPSQLTHPTKLLFHWRKCAAWSHPEAFNSSAKNTQST